MYNCERRTLDLDNVSSVKKGRFERPLGCNKMGLGVSVALSAVSAILAGAFPSNYGGFMFLIVAVGLFAYVLTASFSFFYVGAGAVISVLVAVLCGVKFPLALIALMYIPLAFVISESARTRKNLSTTVAILTMVTVAVLGVAFGVIYIVSGDALVEAVKNIAKGYLDGLEAYIDRINAAAGKTVYTENYIESLKNAVVLLMPSVVILACMGVSYLSAKVFRLATIVGDSNEMFFGGKWPITASLTSSVVFGIAYIVSMFAFNSEIVYYSATNIIYILMPAQAVVGLRLMFGRNGIFAQRRAAKGLRWMTIAVCASFIFFNPILLLMLASMFTVFYNIRMWLMMKKKNNEQ